ncbi:glycosyltransferase family 2 protein [Dyadobacter luteus]|jgi:glycosyltransferase involved in cell wall biosynthesis|uniref:Glycosyltransferase family 2 protein n=1 Tax=Dyadobacter luteus TaxID=2259619 RepID=A0A3D8YBW6_9BACT|nr:glycosyltransferase [Dyadobacter luteus]REA61651.1 glycosyltransferase family 2 protein [Dyadobacter luteus]
MEDRKQPLVSVILTTYNHERFIGECLSAVFAQDYPNIQLIVIDNASADNTLNLIEAAREIHPELTLIRNVFNKGLCKAFNQGLAIAEGKYVIDLSGDDVFFPNRISSQVAAFESCSEDYAVVFSNARYIDVDGKHLQYHFQIDAEGKAIGTVPSGDVYKRVLEKYFICTPTMMMRTSVLKHLGGYDESLAFEDFDFWIRSASAYKYYYLDEILTSKRDVPNSLKFQILEKGSGILDSCYTVCNKAYDLNRDQEEFDLLANRIRSFIRKCLYAQEFDLALKFRKLLNYIENPGWKTEMIVFLCRLHIPVNSLYRFYINNIYKLITSGKDLAFDIVH